MAKLIHKANGVEYWVQYDNDADIWEIFAEPECECYMGCADTLDDAKRVVKDIALNEA